MLYTFKSYSFTFRAQIALGPAIKFNGGGHLNHSIFWQNLSPSRSEPNPELCAAINNSFGSMENLKKKLAAVTIAIQGSGWGWLGFEPQTGINFLVLYSIFNLFMLLLTISFTNVITIPIYKENQ